MTGILRILLFALFAYIIIKAVKFMINIFSALKESKESEKVYNEKNRKTKIDHKDVIEAQFEEIEDENKDSSKKK